MGCRYNSIAPERLEIAGSRTHRQVLDANWNRLTTGEALEKIPPLD